MPARGCVLGKIHHVVPFCFFALTAYDFLQFSMLEEKLKNEGWYLIVTYAGSKNEVCGLYGFDRFVKRGGSLALDRK